MIRPAKLFPLAILAMALAACSQQEPERSFWGEDGEEPSAVNDAHDGVRPDEPAGRNNGFAPSLDMPPQTTNAPPGISVTAAPGVAFMYRYAFVLPSEEIAGQQELHATACEELGRSKCRITGMHYKLVDEDRVEAFLRFKLAPELARGFGKGGIDAVEEAGGRLIEAAISGDDAAEKIAASQEASGRLLEQIEELEATLKRGGISSARRTEISEQIRTLKAKLQAQEDQRDTLSESLANTPMTYYYQSDEDFSLGANPIGDAGETAWLSLSTMFGVILLGLGIALPWVVLFLALLGFWRTLPMRKLRSWIGSFGPRKPEVFGEIK